MWKFLLHKTADSEHSTCVMFPFSLFLSSLLRRCINEGKVMITFTHRSTLELIETSHLSTGPRKQRKGSNECSVKWKLLSNLIYAPGNCSICCINLSVTCTNQSNDEKVEKFRAEHFLENVSSSLTHRHSVDQNKYLFRNNIFPLRE